VRVDTSAALDEFQIQEGGFQPSPLRRQKQSVDEVNQREMRGHESFESVEEEEMADVESMSVNSATPSRAQRIAVRAKQAAVEGSKAFNKAAEWTIAGTSAGFAKAGEWTGEKVVQAKEKIDAGLEKLADAEAQKRTELARKSAGDRAEIARKQNAGPKGKVKRLLRVGDGSRLCDPRRYADARSALDGLRVVKDGCLAKDYHKALAFYCSRHCAKDDASECQTGCHKVCSDYLAFETYVAGESRKNRVRLEGMRACVVQEGGETSVDLNMRRKDAFLKLQKGLASKQAKPFNRVTKACRAAGKTGARALLKLCMNYEKVAAAENQYTARLARRNVNSTVFEELYGRVELEATSEAKARWAAPVSNVSWDKLRAMCMKLKGAVASYRAGLDESLQELPEKIGSQQ